MSNAKKDHLLDAIEIDPPRPAVASLIWLHGLGASGDDFVPIAGELQQLTQLPLRFVFPQAPHRPVTINAGFVMPAWYDVISFDREGEVDHEGIALAVSQVRALVLEEMERGFTTKQIFLAGFSQGAVIALNALLASPEEFAGIIALSGYLPPRKAPSHAHTTPVFIGHGASDEIVPAIYAQDSAATLEKAGYPVTLKVYRMAHSVCDEEVRDLAKWLQGVLAGS